MIKHKVSTAARGAANLAKGGFGVSLVYSYFRNVRKTRFEKQSGLRMNDVDQEKAQYLDEVLCLIQKMSPTDDDKLCISALKHDLPSEMKKVWDHYWNENNLERRARMLKNPYGESEEPRQLAHSFFIGDIKTALIPKFYKDKVVLAYLIE